MALVDVAEGARVLKYAQLIGVARAAIARGEHVHVHNLDFVANDAHEASEAPPPVAVETTDTFAGYRRGDGRCGTRNFVAVLSSVNCSATVAHRIADGFGGTRTGGGRPSPNTRTVDGVAAFTHGTGAAAWRGRARGSRTFSACSRATPATRTSAACCSSDSAARVSQIGVTAASAKGLAERAAAADDEHPDQRGVRRRTDRARASRWCAAMLPRGERGRGREPCPSAEL